MVLGKPNTLCKESELRKHIYMTQETAAQILEINLSPAMETSRQRNSRVNQCK